MHDQASPSRINTQDVVLLGASNLVLGWQAVINSLRLVTGEPINLNVALGMGRSYVKTSAFWFRQLPAIRSCGLWDQLPRDSANPPLVLITDLGNDIVYLFEPDQITASVRECIRQILDWRSDAKIVMTGLPLASLTRAGKLQFRIAKTIMFPGCTLSQSSILERSQVLDQLARQLAVEFGISFVEPEPHWYGLDSIHVVPEFRETAFRKYFSAFGNVLPAGETQPSAKGRIELPTAAVRTVFGRNRIVEQPVYRESDLVVSAW
ncbi:MAG: SGNH/GDSL hydrolase family protein [Planctomycetaceae bacterium]